MMLRKMGLLLFSLLLLPFLVEGLLRVFDPWGAYYYDDLDWVVSEDISQKAGGAYYEVPSGKWGFYFDQTRRVPDTQASDCQIVALGDSLTFGYGVNDEETWVNLLAIAYPEVAFINAGITGYNTAQVYRRAQAFPADGYLYLIVYNDAEGPMVFERREYRWYAKTKLMRYWDTWRKISQPSGLGQFSTFGLPTPEPIRYFLWGELENAPPDALSIPIDHRISFIDEHPNPAGHRAIFERMHGPVGDFIREIC